MLWIYRHVMVQEVLVIPEKNVEACISCWDGCAPNAGRELLTPARREAEMLGRARAGSFEH